MTLWQTREVTDKFTIEVEMDRQCYEELLDERKNMELQYEERIAQLQDRHAEVGTTQRGCSKWALQGIFRVSWVVK